MSNLRITEQPLGANVGYSIGKTVPRLSGRSSGFGIPEISLRACSGSVGYAVRPRLPANTIPRHGDAVDETLVWALRGSERFPGGEAAPRGGAFHVRNADLADDLADALKKDAFPQEARAGERGARARRILRMVAKGRDRAVAAMGGEGAPLGLEFFARVENALRSSKIMLSDFRMVRSIAEKTARAMLADKALTSLAYDMARLLRVRELCPRAVRALRATPHLLDALKASRSPEEFAARKNALKTRLAEPAVVTRIAYEQRAHQVKEELIQDMLILFEKISGDVITADQCCTRALGDAIADVLDQLKERKRCEGGNGFDVSRREMLKATADIAVRHARARAAAYRCIKSMRGISEHLRARWIEASLQTSTLPHPALYAAAKSWGDRLTQSGRLPELLDAIRGVPAPAADVPGCRPGIPGLPRTPRRIEPAYAHAPAALYRVLGVLGDIAGTLCEFYATGQENAHIPGEMLYEDIARRAIEVALDNAPALKGALRSCLSTLRQVKNMAGEERYACADDPARSPSAAAIEHLATHLIENIQGGGIDA